jgi:hypothetical protein
LQLIQELAGVSRETFDVFALALGINRVKGEGRFAAAAEAGDDDETVAGDLERFFRLCSRAPPIRMNSLLMYVCESCFKTKWSSYGKPGKKQRGKQMEVAIGEEKPASGSGAMACRARPRDDNSASGAPWKPGWPMAGDR